MLVYRSCSTVSAVYFLIFETTERRADISCGGNWLLKYKKTKRTNKQTLNTKVEQTKDECN